MKTIAYDLLAVTGTTIGLKAEDMQFLQDGVKLIAGLVGIIFVIVSIRHKLLEIRKLKQDGSNTKTTPKKD